MLSTLPKIITIVNSQSYPKQMRTPNIFYFAATKLKYSLVARMPGLQHNSQIRTIFPATQLSGSFWIWIPTHSFHQEEWETGGFHEGLDHCIHYNIQGSTRLIYSSQSKARTLQSISKNASKKSLFYGITILQQWYQKQIQARQQIQWTHNLISQEVGLCVDLE